MLFKKRHPKVGARPGTLMIAEGALPPKIHVMHFDAQQVIEEDVSDIETLWKAYEDETVTWIDVQGFGDEATLRRIGEIFSIHPLVMEDIINVPQRPKAELYGDQLFLTTRTVAFQKTKRIDIEQVSIVLGKNYILSFQEGYGDLFAPIRKRVHNPKGRMRQYGAGYLAYALFDTVIDAYYPALESLGGYLEQLEDQIIRDPSPEVLRRLNRIKNQLVQLRRSIWPQREAATSLIRDPNPLISDDVRIYLRDTYDHCVQTAEVTEMYREMASGLMNTYLSAVANRTNDVMKVLAIVATLFIPPTFLAGVFGMNFEHMPELELWWAYPVVWSLMIGSSVGMLFFFHRKGWIGKGSRNHNGNMKNHAKK